MKKILLITAILFGISYASCGSPYEFKFWGNYKCDGNCEDGEGVLKCIEKGEVHTLKGTFKNNVLEKGVEKLFDVEEKLIYKKEGIFRKGQFWNLEISSTKKPELEEGTIKKIAENCEEYTYVENRVIKNIIIKCKEEDGNTVERKYDKDKNLEEITTYFGKGEIEKRVAEYKDGKQDGKTLHYYKNGDKLIFELKDGELNGKVSGYDKDGAKIEGTKLDNKRHGEFIYSYENGDKKIEQYSDDKLITEEFFYKRKTKGYLEKDFKIVNKDKFMEIIPKGEYLEISEDRKHIISPEKYNLIPFEKAPILKISANQREIKIEIKKDETNSGVISFELDTNVKIKSIEIDDIEMRIINDEDYKYIVDKIKPARDDFSLKIILEDSATIIYDCNINGNCNLKDKKEI